MKRADTHIHGNYSSDSDLDYLTLCKKAIERDYEYITFTEHYDLLESELAVWGLPPLQNYFYNLDIIKDAFPELMIAKGIELGEPHRVMDLAQKLFGYFKPEYVIGSLHVTRSGMNVSLSIDRELSESDITEYYEENLEMVQKGGFDTLGHLGIYKRGIGKFKCADEKHVHNLIDEIFREMVKKDICLEVNNSGFKSHINDSIPDFETLKRYKKLGGELICISSDSHSLEHFDRFYDKTLDNLREIGFRCTHWVQNGIFKEIMI